MSEMKQKDFAVNYSKADFDKKMKRHFGGHRMIPSGRNFRFWERSEKPEDRDSFRQNFDQINWETEPPGKGLA